jgi:TusA-related sulfurtransferase
VTDPIVEIVRTLDLRGVACPLNYVKTRVALERLTPGEALEVWLDHGEPEENVPRSCDEDGFQVVSLADAAEEGAPGFVRLVVTGGR